MIVAIINFVNFAIALAPRRIKAINTYRILGHTLAGLRWMLIFEAIFISIVSFLLSMAFVQLISDTSFENIFSSSITVLDNIDVIFVMGVFAVVIGIIAGIYPAFYMTNFSPIFVLNGGKSLPKSALKIRQLLISFQYVISISMILISVFINLQNSYFMNKDYGYDTENLLEVEVKFNHEKIRDELTLNYPFIEDVTYSTHSIVRNQNLGKFTYEDVMFDVVGVYPNYVELMGMEIIEGDDFVEGDLVNSDGYMYALFNESAKKKMNLHLGQKVESNRRLIVKGFFKDINHKSLHSEVGPLVLFPRSNGNVMSIKYIGGENIGNVVDVVRKVVAEINDGEIADISTADQMRYEAYKKDANLNTIISWAAMLAILISIIGVIGLISLESQHRIREIALRKVHGATTGEILKMFNVKFVKIVAVCYIISVPLSWWIVDKWLQGFEYRVSMSWWIFVGAGVFIASLTVFVVTAQSYKAATTNPAQAMNN